MTGTLFRTVGALVVAGLCSLSANALTVTYTSYLNSSGWTQTTNTSIGDPLYLEAQLLGDFLVPLIDPQTYIITAVSLDLTMSGGGESSSANVATKYGGYDLAITSGLLPVNYSDNDDWTGVGTVGGGLISHSGTAMPSGLPFNYYGTAGSASNLDTTLLGFDLLLAVGSDAGDIAYAYLDEAYIEITYELLDIGGGPGGPNFPTGPGSGSGWDTQILPNAVPVPGALWLFTSALAGLGWLRRKKMN